MNDAGTRRCSGCGLAVAGGDDGCNALFNDLAGRSFSDIRFGGVHRMAVDAYALQHPDRYCISAKSLVAHLCGLCELIERDGNPAMPNRHLRQWLDGSVDITKPALPAEHGRTTIGDVLAIDSPPAYREAVGAWASDVWMAYAELHGLAREWLDRAYAESRRGKN